MLIYQRAITEEKWRRQVEHDSHQVRSYGAFGVLTLKNDAKSSFIAYPTYNIEYQTFFEGLQAEKSP